MWLRIAGYAFSTWAEASRLHFRGQATLSMGETWVWNSGFLHPFPGFIPFLTFSWWFMPFCAHFIVDCYASLQHSTDTQTVKNLVSVRENSWEVGSTLENSRVVMEAWECPWELVSVVRSGRCCWELFSASLLIVMFYGTFSFSHLVAIDLWTTRPKN